MVGSSLMPACALRTPCSVPLKNHNIEVKCRGKFFASAGHHQIYVFQWCTLEQYCVQLDQPDANRASISDYFTAMLHALQ